jgi:hypothetical protein
MQNSQELFDRWFVNPLGQLQSIPNGDGGFITLATCCFLYERYAIAILKKHGTKADRPSLVRQLAADFDVSEETAEAFWSVVRDGILHQGLPKQLEHGKSNLPGYILHHSFTEPVELVDWDGEPALKIQPWMFMFRVIKLWQDNFELLEASASFPFPRIM